MHHFFTSSAFIVENDEKTYIFTQKWLDHLLLMKLYLEIIVTDRTKLVSKRARGIKERQVLMFSHVGGSSPYTSEGES